MIVEIGLIFVSMLIGVLMNVAPSQVPLFIDMELVVYLLLIGVNYFRNKFFTLYQVWLVAFVFVVWSEMCIIANGMELLRPYLLPFTRFIVANGCFMLGYHYQNKKKGFGRQQYYLEHSSRLFMFVVVACYVYFVIRSSQRVFQNATVGRQLSGASGSGSLKRTLINALGMMLPAIIAFYLKNVRGKGFFLSLIVCLPILIIEMFLATRYKFLFAVLPFLIVTGVFSISKRDKRRPVILIASVAAVLMISTFVKENRNTGLLNTEQDFFVEDNENTNSVRFSVKLAKEMSPEGVVRMARMADTYFKTHPLHLGKESSFILYFWFPRSLWPDKPIQLDYWLIREYYVVSDTYSSASGFIGELRADFGWGCLFFVFLFGLLVRRLDAYVQYVNSQERIPFNIVLVSIFYPWIFFFVRSPITSTMSLLWELLLFLVFSKFFFNNPQIRK